MEGLPLPIELQNSGNIEGVRGAFIRFQHSPYCVPAKALSLRSEGPLVCATRAPPYGLL
jgi:hypothetical protein